MESEQIRRYYSPEFKRGIVEGCRKPGGSVASTARAHGINANMVHRWIQERESGVGWGTRGPKEKYSDEFRQAIVDECLEPGTIMSDVARARGLSPKLVQRWVQRLRKSEPMVARWIPIRLEESSAPGRSSVEGSLGREGPSPASGAVALRSPEGRPLVLEISGARLLVPVCHENFLDTLRVILEHLK
jgi:transposase-like protein